jgi:hypothetical protein
VLSTGIQGTAQELSGKFTLTHEARWGTAVLPAGTYSASVHREPLPYVLISSEDRNGVSIMAFARYVETAQCKTSSLELEQYDGVWDVRSFCLQSSVAAYFGSRTEKMSHAAPAQVASLAPSH